MSESAIRGWRILRTACFADAIVFLAAALLNFGLQLSLGFAEIRFPDPIWQAGIGEAVIGLALFTAAVTGRIAAAWVAFWLSVLGIAAGLKSARVQGLARDIHIILVPLALIIFSLLLWRRQQSRRPSNEALGLHGER